MPTTLGFGFGAHRWHDVLALWTLIVKVAGSIFGLQARFVCVFSVTALVWLFQFF